LFFILIYFVSVWAVDWTYESVDGYNIDMIHSSLALDKNGWPHIAYRDNSNGNLKYAYRDSAGWHISTVQTGLNCYWPSLALDTNGYPHIAYKTASGGNILRYSYKEASGWHHEIVHQSSGADIGSFPSLVLDDSNRPHIAYRADFGGGSNYVYYAFKRGTSWSTQCAASNPFQSGENGGIALALDSYKEPHIVFFNTSGDIIHAWRKGPYEGWTSEIAVSGTGGGTRLSITMDGNIVHVSYNKENGEDLGYAKKTSAGWSNEIVDGTGHAGDWSVIGLDYNRYPHISYVELNNKQIKYARLTPSGWQIETPYYGGSGVGYTSLGLNVADEPHISAWCYYGSYDYRLKFFRPRSYGPRAFSLLSPANGSWTNAQPKFRWQQCAYRGDSLLRYELWIDGVLNKVVPKTQPYAIPDNPLPAGWRTWRVKAFKINGDSILSTESWSIRIDPNPPIAFNLTSPASNIWTRSRKPTFTWQASSDAESGLRKYQIYIDNTLVNDSVPATSSPSGQPIWRLPDGVHTWYIKAVDNVGNVRQSNQTWIIKIDSTPPDWFSLVSPPNYSWTAESCPTFKWRRTTDAGIGVSHYQLWIYTTAWTLWIDSIPQGTSETLSVTVPISRPLPHGTRRWYIAAIDSLGNTQYSSTWTLYVDLLPPNPFSLSSPRNDSLVGIPTPIFHWRRTTDPGIGGIRYQLWIDSVPNVVGLRDTFTAPSTPLAEGLHHWFVLAIDSLGWVRKSNETWRVILDWNPPDTFSLIRPINNDTVTPLPTLIWHPSFDRGSGIKKYQLWIDGVINRDSIPSTDTTTTPTSPLSLGTHNWFVKAYDYAGGITSSNNTGSFWVAQFDAGVTQIITPSGIIDSGSVITPQARVKNFGNIRASFPVIFRIGTFYSDTSNVSNLNPGDSVIVGFRSWTAVQRGIQTTKCSTALAGDANPANNSQTGSVTVRVRDIGVIQIVAPTGVVDSGATIVPQARVQNYGNTTETFPVTFRIGTFYTQTRNKTLSAGVTDTVNFPAWTAVQPGTHTTKCSTALTGDMNPSNDFLADSVVVRVRDVGVTQIITPSGTVDSGTVVIPQIRIKNYGNRTESFPATFRIGAFYSNTQNVTLNPGDSTVVSFASWTAVQRGTHTTKCTTALLGDQNPANNALTGSVTVRVRDIGVIQIVAPTGVVDSGATIVPQARVQNYGNTTETFPVTFRIGTFYTQTRNKTLSAGVTDTVNFPAWTAVQPGTHTTKCSTALTGDMNPSNDFLADSVVVRVRDVGVTQIITPSGTVDSGTVVIPQIRIKNYGNRTESFPATFRIGAFYSNTQNVTLNPGDSTVVSFASWTAVQRGTHTTKCTTALLGDQNPANNALTGSVTVRVLDVGVATILAPSGIIDSGATVTPQVKVKNFGNEAVSFPVWFRIRLADNIAKIIPASVRLHSFSLKSEHRTRATEHEMTDQVYEDSIWLTLAPNDSTIRDFRSWTPTIPNTYRLESFTALSSDMNLRNDSAYGSVVVRRPVHDVGAIRILAPIGTIDSGQVVIPRAIVQNFGTVSENFPVRFQIGTFYYDDTLITLAAGRADTVRFTPWTASQIGVHITKCTTRLAGDINSTNDFVRDSVRVIPFVEIVESYFPQPIPTAFVLQDNFPNPFISKTLIRYALPKDCQVNLKVYNSSGILVRTLKTGNEKAGFYRVIWDGCDEQSKKVPNGVYFYRLEAGEFIATKKMVKME